MRTATKATEPVTLGVPPRRINEIVLGKRAITGDTDVRLARYWGASEGFFRRLQNSYDLQMQRKMAHMLAGLGRGRLSPNSALSP